MIILNKNLATRMSAQNLFEKIKKESDYSLDFKNVIIASRSFTNEFVNLEKKHKIEVKKKNIKKDVKMMFDIADKPLNSSILQQEKYSTVSIDKYAHLI